MAELSGTYFTQPEPGWFIPTDHSRGPWDKDSCHAGPPTGLLARAMEHTLVEAGVGHQLVRLTVNLIQPIPMHGFRVNATLTRRGRSTSNLAAEIVDGNGVEKATATGLALRADLDAELPTHSAAAPEFDLSATGGFPISRSLHDLPGFSGSVEIRYPPGELPGTGPTTAWMRSIPLLAGETASGFQRICPLADCGNALSRNAEPWEVGFVNPDLTLALHRTPVGSWLASRTRSHWETNGIGMATATLYDRQGVVGQAIQTLLLRPQQIS